MLKRLPRTLLLVLTLIELNSLAAQTNYSNGDTLNVVALGGINLRKGPGSNYDVVTKANNAEQLIIKSITNYKDSIEFNGRWVEVYSLDNSKRGYAFDVFLSRFPVVNELTTIQKFKRVDACWQGMITAAQEYVSKAFNEGASTKYHNGYDGEGAMSIEIVELGQHARFIKHGGYEGGKNELELFNARPSEAYYLIKNMIKQIKAEILESDAVIINETALMNPMNVNTFKYECAFSCGDCTIELREKQNKTISIFFAFYCC
ncbi:SH3 domain-containing protein [Ekhidna sp. MALMAid0563]|uniref:SH3 domain-containing protein n=1 Tax=Ekhidna sp. MALMAid0563 TaxID=3143937 RepID=UPI0032DEDCDF